MMKHTKTELVVISAWGSRVISSITGILVITVLLDNLGESQYSSYILLASLGGWYALFDFGIGYSLQNSISKKLALNTNPAVDILAAFYMLAFITVVSILTLSMVDDSLAGWLLGKFGDIDQELKASLVFTSGSIFILAAIASVANKILYGRHLGYLANTLTGVGSLLGFLLLWYGIGYFDNKIGFAIVALAMPTNLLFLFILFKEFLKASKIKPALNKTDFVLLARPSGSFLLFNLIAAAVLQVDYLIMSQLVSPSEIISYSTAMKFFGIISFIFNAILFSLWPTFTDAHARKDYMGLINKIDKIVVIGFAYTIICVGALYLLLPIMLPYLSKKHSITISTELIVLLGTLGLMRVVTDVHAIYLQSIGHLTPLILIATIQAVIGVLLQWYLAGLYGVNGMVLGLIISFLLTAVWALPYYARKNIRDGMLAR